MEKRVDLNKAEELISEWLCPRINYNFDWLINKEEKHNLVVALGPSTFRDVTRYFLEEIKPLSVLNVSIDPKTDFFTFYMKGELKTDFELMNLFKFKNVLYLVGMDLYPQPPFLLQNEYLALYRKIWKDLALTLKKNFNIEKCVGFRYAPSNEFGVVGFPISKCEETFKKFNLKTADYMKGTGGDFSLMRRLSELNIESFALYAGVKLPTIQGMILPNKSPSNITENPMSTASRNLFKKLEEILEIDLNFSKFEIFLKKIEEEEKKFPFMQDRYTGVEPTNKKINEGVPYYT